MYRFLLILYFSIALSGCAIMARPYVDATGDNIAYFTVKAPSASYLTHATTFAEAERCKGAYLISWFFPQKQTVLSKTIKIPADKDFVYRIGSQYLNDKLCLFTVSFKPVKGKKYFATIDYEASNNLCRNILYEKNKGQKLVVPDAFLKSNTGGTRMDQNSTWCSEDKIEKYVK